MAGATGGSFGSDTNWGGRPQIINGQTYSQYTPQWYDAMRQDEIRRAGTAGTALGTGGANALKALSSGTGVPISGSASSSTGVGSSGVPPRIGAAGSVPGVSSSMSGLQGAMGFPGLSGSPSGGSSPVGQIAPIDMTAADNAAFGRAKDQVGQTSAGALAGLRSSLGGRGLLGSGGEFRGTTNVINAGQQQLGDVSRAQAINDVGMNLDVAKANQGAALTGRGQDLGYSATTRGQDIGAQETYRGQDVTQRGQDIQSQEAASQLALTKSLADAARQQQIMQGLLGALGPGATAGGLY